MILKVSLVNNIMHCGMHVILYVIQVMLDLSKISILFEKMKVLSIYPFIYSILHLMWR